MIELFYVANLVDNDVITDFGRHEDEFVIEIEIPFLGTAAPTAFLIPYGYPGRDDAVLHAIVSDEMLDSLGDHLACIFFVRVVELTTPRAIDSTKKPHTGNGCGGRRE
jgi:hypothetical protein